MDLVHHWYSGFAKFNHCSFHYFERASLYCSVKRLMVFLRGLKGFDSPGPVFNLSSLLGSHCSRRRCSCETGIFVLITFPESFGSSESCTELTCQSSDAAAVEHEIVNCLGILTANSQLFRHHGMDIFSAE